MCMEWPYMGFGVVTHNLRLHFIDHCYRLTSALSLLVSNSHCQVTDPTNGDSSFSAHVATVRWISHIWTPFNWLISNWTLSLANQFTSLHFTQLNCTQPAWGLRYLASGGTQQKILTPKILLLVAIDWISFLWECVYWPSPSNACSFSWSLHSNATISYTM
jgi:hypothetical protein